MLLLVAGVVIAGSLGGDWAEVHAQVASDSSIAGRYTDAVALAQLGRPGDAMQAFADVIRAVDAHGGTRVPAARAVELDRDRELAILGIARVLYGLERYTEAAAWDDRIGRRSPRWPDAQLEAAWADFIRGDLAQAHARTERIRKANAWRADLPWLEYLVVDALDWDERMACTARKPPHALEAGAREAALRRVWAELDPAQAALSTVVAGEQDVSTLRPELQADPARLLREVTEALVGVRVQEDERRFVGYTNPGSLERCW